MHAGIHPHLGLDPPGPGPADPPGQTPQPPPGYGPGPGDPSLAIPLNLPPGYGPVDRMTDTCKNIAFANFVCGR